MLILKHVVAVPFVKTFFCKNGYKRIFLPGTVNFLSLATFRRSIQSVDFTDFLKCSLC